MQADVVYLHRGAVGARAVYRDLELARQPGEFGMEGRPLPDHLAPEERIHDLVGGDTGEVVGGYVAHAVARGLDGVHLHARELGEHVRHFFELRPVVLDVLARAEVAVAPVVLARNVGELAQLRRGEQAVGNCHAQHRRVALDVQAVAQSQRAEFVLGELAREVAARLVAELGDALVDELLVDFVVDVHVRPISIERDAGADGEQH